MTYNLVICRPGQKRAVCEFSGIIAQDEPPQLGEERVIVVETKNKRGYPLTCRVNIRFVRKQKGVMFLDNSALANWNGLRETSWCVMYAEPTAKNYEAGLKRLCEFAKRIPPVR